MYSFKRLQSIDKTCIFVIELLLVLGISVAIANDDPRYCGFVPRDSDGDIKRSSSELRKFQLNHPCPSTGLTTGSCDGWSIDHVIPLACGGCDLIFNMQWLPLTIKSCSGTECKDRWERKIQYVDPNTSGLNPKGCSPEVLPFNN